MGKTRVIAETGAGQHGSHGDGLRCWHPLRRYMGAVDIERQAPNVFRMKLLGAEVVPVETGLDPERCDERGVARLGCPCRRYGTSSARSPARILTENGTDFQSVIGNEAREQIMKAEGRLPDRWCVIGGGSNAMAYSSVSDDDGIDIIGVGCRGWIETAVRGLSVRNRRAARQPHLLAAGR